VVVVLVVPVVPALPQVQPGVVQVAVALHQ
jgi:hypothetical protein